MKRSTRETFYPPVSAIDPDEQLCPVCGQPATGEVYRPTSGDPIIRYRCPVNGDVIGTTTQRMRDDAAARRAAA